MKALEKVWSETRVLYHDKKSGFWVASFFFINKLIDKMYIHFAVFMFKRRWRVKRNGVKMYDFNGAFMPDIKNFSYAEALKVVYEDSFLVSCHYGDNYDKKTVEFVDSMTKEGPYGYKDGAFDVTVKEGDVVIDAGAWAGDFSAYSASKGATCYAFEPTPETYGWLIETSSLNSGNGKIVPVNMGLGDKKDMMKFAVNGISGKNRIVKAGQGKMDKNESLINVPVTTLDAFVEENNLQRVDFIKSDIEGFERNLLMGGVKTLRRFAPKLAICTYHLPDDPEVLSRIIKEANPDYTVVQMRHKLFACVERKPASRLL